MLGPLSYLDIALIVIAGLSGLLAMYRGFTREILSILSWALAAGAGLYVGVKKLDWAQQLTDKFHIPNKIITQVGLGGLVFLVVLVIVHLITARISDGILDSRVGMIDRVLGFTFGVLRGFLLIVILFAFFEFLYPSDTKLGVDSRQAAAPKTYPYGIRTKRLPDWLPGESPRGDVVMTWIVVDHEEASASRRQPDRPLRRCLRDRPEEGPRARGVELGRRRELGLDRLDLEEATKPARRRPRSA